MSCTCWEVKSTDLFFLGNRSQNLISSFTTVGVKCLPFGGIKYFSPLSFTESCDNSLVKILSAIPATFLSMSQGFCCLVVMPRWGSLRGHCLSFDLGHEVAGREFRLWPLLKSMPVNYCTLTLSGCLVSNTLYFCMLACISFVTQKVFGSITVASYNFIGPKIIW